MYGDDSTRYKTFTRRTAMIAGGKLVILSVLVGRMYQLQVIEADRYATLAEENRISLRLLLPRRGRIIDRQGTPLAMNRENFRVQLVAENARNVEATLDELTRYIPLTDLDRQRIMKEVRRRRRFVPITIRENLEWEDVAKLEVNSIDLPGIGIDVGQSREYPYRADAVHILGYVGAVTEQELTGEPLLDHPDFRIGKNGIEKAYDLGLRGSAGTRQVEVNAAGRIIKELKRHEGKRGEDVQLTIDMSLQRFTMERLAKEQSAAAVAMDIHTGEVLVLASSPSFDPNDFVKGLSSKEWRALATDPRAPLTSKAISGLYSPGSTFKMVVALAALESGVSPPEHLTYCRGHMKLGNGKFHCWKKYGHGWMNLHQAIQQSCDVYFYELSKKVGIERIAKMSRRLGLGATVGIELPGEKAGLIPTKEWKRAVTGVPWQQGETLVAAIGQGFILTTPLQLAVMTARLANGGRAVTPHMVRKVEPPVDVKNADESGGDKATTKSKSKSKAKGKKTKGTKPFPRIGINSAALRIVLEGMNAVTNIKKGTAYYSRIKEEGMEMAGKTGTSQVRRISKRERDTRVKKNHERPWKDRDHALFVGFAPQKRPRYAVSVVVEHGGSGSKAAAPIARDILLEIQRLEEEERKTRMARKTRKRGKT